jgi:iron complex outermembrane receptor protein
MLSHVLPLVSLLAATAVGDTMVVPMKEIVVTGSRVRESALRAPAALSVVDSRQYATTRKLSLADALVGVPGVFVQSRAGAQDVRITIRGYGARGSGERSNVGNIRGIRVLTDGVPVTEPDGRTSLDLVDLGSVSRIEVSRSNASALYGNASGGVLDLRTSFSFDRPYAEASENAGSFGFHREQFVGGFTLGRARSVLSVAGTTFAGWREHSEMSSTTASLRTSVPLDDETRLGLLADFASNLSRFPGALTAAELAADPVQANGSFVSRDDRRRNRVGRVAATLERGTAKGDLGAALWVEPKYLIRSERNRYREFNRYHVGGNAVYGVNYRLGGAAARSAIGGDEDYQDGAIMFFGLNPDGSKNVASVVANKREGANSAGVFAQQVLTWERWSVQAAVRFDDLWYISEDNLEPALNSTRRFTHVTPKASASYRLADHTIYAALGGGVESPAFNEIDPPPTYPIPTAFNPFLEPMISTTVELGARGTRRSAWGSYRYDVAAYAIEVKHDIVPYNDGAFFYTAGKTRRAGVEASLAWQPVEVLALTGNVTASRNRYVEYTNFTGTFDDNDVAGLPSLVFGGSARYRFADDVTAEVGVNGSGEYFADDANTAGVTQYGLLNASVGYDHAFGPTTLRAFASGNNLLDKDYVGSVFINGVNLQYFEPGLPRNFNFGLSLRWQ